MTTKLHYSSCYTRHSLYYSSLHQRYHITWRIEPAKRNDVYPRKEETRFYLTSNYRTMRNLLVVDGRGGHKQAGESGHSGVDRAPFTKAARLTILHRIAGHEEWRGLGRKSVVIRFRPLRSWGVQISLGCSRWRRGKISKAPRSWPSKEPANKFDGNYLIVIDRRDESYPTPGLSAVLHRECGALFALVSLTFRARFKLNVMNRNSSLLKIFFSSFLSRSYLSYFFILTYLIRRPEYFYFLMNIDYFAGRKRKMVKLIRSMYCFYTAENKRADPNFGKLGSYCWFIGFVDSYR